MSPRCEWLVLCGRVLCDAQSNNLTLVDCLEQVGAKSFPAHHTSFAFAAKFDWEGEPPESDRGCAFRLVRGSEHEEPEEIARLEGRWRAGTRRTRVFTNFSVLRLRRPEVLWFRIDHQLDGGEWIEGCTAQLEVHQVKPAEAPDR